MQHRRPRQRAQRPLQRLGAGRVADRAARMADRRREPPLRQAERASRTRPRAPPRGGSTAPRRRSPSVPANPPHASANHQSVWKRPPNSSRLYAGTRNAPTAMNASRPQPHVDGAVDADRQRARERDDRRARRASRAGCCVRSGRPFSSSSACAATPIASANAASAQSMRSRWKSRRERGADRDVGEMPRRVRRVEQRDVVAPAAGAERVERGPDVVYAPASPRHDPAAERHPPRLHVLDPGGAPRVEQPRLRPLRRRSRGSTARGTSPTSCQPWPIARPAAGRPARTHSSHAGRASAVRQRELERGDRPARPHDARQLARSSRPGRRRSGRGR